MGRLSSNTASLQSILEAANNLLNGAKTNLQDKTVTPTKATQIVTADSNYQGLKQVTVNAIPEGYINTSDTTATAADILANKTAYVNGEKITGTIATRTASDITTSGATMFVPSGYYNEQTVKSFPTATQATPSITVDTNGLITATTTQDAGYVSAGTKTSTYQLAFQAAKTITPRAMSQIAVSSGHYTGGDITVAGDSNLVAENIRKGTSIFGISGTLDAGRKWSENEYAIINRTISGVYVNDRVEFIGAYAFQFCYNLTTASFPVCTTIGDWAFARCDSLTTASFPACTSIGSNAFNYCSSLITASFPVCTSIGSSAFFGCSSLTTASFPACTSIGSNAFNHCYNLTTASFPVCTNIGYRVFAFCSSLTTASFPACTSISSDVFYHCYNLTTASFPACTSIGSNAFNYCYNLTTASFPACTSIGNSAFYNCRVISSLMLGASSVCTLTNSNAFSSTPFAGYSSYFSGTPHIYVPSSLITTYQSATNWVYYSSYFSSIESLPITFTIDGVEHSADYGMTWGEWVESDYNTDGYYIDFDGGIAINSVKGADGIFYEGDIALESEKIVHEREYYLVTIEIRV